MLALEVAGAAEAEVLTANVSAVAFETAGVEVAEALVANENPVPKEAVEAEVPTPNPAKDDPPLAALEAPLAGAEEPVTLNAGTEDNSVVLLLVAAVETVVVVEKRGADDVANVKELGFEAAGVAETEIAEADEAGAGAEAETAALVGNPKEG